MGKKVTSFTDKLLQTRGEAAQSREAYVTQSVQDMVADELQKIAKKRGFSVSQEQQKALDASVAEHTKLVLKAIPKYANDDTLTVASTKKIQELMTQTLAGKRKQEQFDNGLEVLTQHVPTIDPAQVFSKGNTLLNARVNRVRGTIVKTATPDGVLTQFVQPNVQQKDFNALEQNAEHASPFTSTESKLNAGVTLAIAAMSAVGAYSNFKHAVEPTVVEDGHGGATIENKVNWSNMTWGVVNTALAGAFAYMGTKSAKQSGLFR